MLQKFLFVVLDLVFAFPSVVAVAVADAAAIEYFEQPFPIFLAYVAFDVQTNHQIHSPILEVASLGFADFVICLESISVVHYRSFGLTWHQDSYFVPILPFPVLFEIAYLHPLLSQLVS